MKKLNNPFDNAWFVEPTITKATEIDSIVTKYTITKPKEIVVIKKIIYDIENYNANGICECGQSLDQSWKYCPKCGGKLKWE